ncbi:MAG: carboxypeptidase-like regulatory domain-containing protein [Thermoguttaceae bacterium]
MPDRLDCETLAGRAAAGLGLARAARFAALALPILLGAGQALAHRVNVFATVEGRSIVGQVTFVDGSPARNAAVTALDPAGAQIGRTATDQQGRFSLPLRVRCDHRLVVEAGEGHTKTFTVPGDQIPGDLPAWGALRDSAAGPPAAGALPPGTAASDSPFEPLEASGTMDLRLQALEKQLAALRIELAGYENKVRLHDILGGIGCILGFMGLTFYFLGVRRREKRPDMKTLVTKTQ